MLKQLQKEGVNYYLSLEPYLLRADSPPPWGSWEECLAGVGTKAARKETKERDFRTVAYHYPPELLLYFKRIWEKGLFEKALTSVLSQVHCFNLLLGICV